MADEKRARRLPPRKKGGVFGTSEAKKRRIAKGLEAPKKPGKQAAGGIKVDIMSKAPMASPEVAKEVARLCVGDKALKDAAIRAFQSAESRLMKELRTSLIASAPRAAAYLSDLVDGIHDEAPHAVRAGAASKLIDSAMEIAKIGNVNKDLAEMDYADLQAEVSRLANELGARGADDAEVVADVIRPARRALE